MFPSVPGLLVSGAFVIACFTGCFKLFLFFLVYKCYMVAILFFMIRFIDVCLQRLCVLRDPLGTARKLHLLILGKIVHRFFFRTNDCYDSTFPSIFHFSLS